MNREQAEVATQYEMDQANLSVKTISSVAVVFLVTAVSTPAMSAINSNEKSISGKDFLSEINPPKYESFMTI